MNLGRVVSVIKLKSDSIIGFMFALIIKLFLSASTALATAANPLNQFIMCVEQEPIWKIQSYTETGPSVDLWNVESTSLHCSQKILELVERWWVDLSHQSKSWKNLSNFLLQPTCEDKKSEQRKRSPRTSSSVSSCQEHFIRLSVQKSSLSVSSTTSESLFSRAAASALEKCIFSSATRKSCSPIGCNVQSR